MADLISRLKLDSGEFDSKIKRAGQELLAYSEHCKKMGLEMGYANKDAKDFAKALGNMNTVSQTARGKLNELTEAFVNLKAMYNNMTDAEKQNTFGKELAASLDKLKNRIDEAKQNLNSVNAELGNTKQAEDGAKSGLEGLTSALGINVKSLAGWGAALTAGKVALDVAKDAFFASEANVDEWGRTVQSAQGLYEGFLNALNTGDISGYLSRMNDIVTAARAAYDELDKLGTMKTIQAPKVSAQQTENERIRSMIQTGRYIAPVDGRRNAVFNGREMQNGDKLTAGQIRALEKQLQNGMQNVVKLVGNEVNQTGKAIDAYYNSMAKQNGMSLQEFKKGTSTWEEFSKKMQGYEEYKKWDKQARTEFAKQGGRGNVDFDKNNPFAEFKKWGVFRVDKEGGNSYKDLVQLIQQRDQQAGQAYSMQSQAYRTMNRAEGFTVSKLMGNGGKGGKTGEVTTPKETKVEEILPEGSMADLQKKMSDLKKEQSKVTDPTDWQIYASLIADVTAKMDALQGKTKQAEPDMKLSKSAQTELDFMMGPTNLASVNQYISGIKDQLKDANLGDEVYTSLTEKLKDATTVSTLLQEMMERGLAGADLESTAQALKEKLLSPEGIDQTAIQSFLEELNKQIEEAGGVGLKLNADTGEVSDKDKGKDDGDGFMRFHEDTNKMTSGLSQVSSGLKSLGIDIPKEVDQMIGVINGVSQVISGIGTIISLVGAGTMTANTTAVGLNTAAIGALIAAIEVNTATSLISGLSGGGMAWGGKILRAATGTIVPGNYGYDAVPALLTSGEVVLNRAQQGNLASQLEGGGQAQGIPETRISGEDIWITLNNYTQRSGYGEIVTSNIK